MIDDRLLAAHGANKRLLEIVDRLCRARGIAEERTKMALQATRIGILDVYEGSGPYDRSIHQMCHYARRNDRFFGHAYRILLATLGPSALPLGIETPHIEAWHEEMGGIIRDAVYECYGRERAGYILANHGIVPSPADRLA